MLESGRAEVRGMILDVIRDTSLSSLADELEPVFAGGKMLRANLVLGVGPAGGVDKETLLACASAVEMIHAASLVHDDVIDGGEMRRGAPSFWVRKGASGAILLGDLLVCRAIELLCKLPSSDTLVPALVRFAGEMCNAEAEQELVLRGVPSVWNQCVNIARRKTGSLFAFAGHVCGSCPESRLALEQAGYALGTAYQLADDFYDAYGDPLLADKTLGHDAGREKGTTASSWETDGREPLAYIDRLCESSLSQLDAWPAVQMAWSVYLVDHAAPAMEQFLEPFRRQVSGAGSCVGS